MRIANYDGRLALIHGTTEQWYPIDVATASGGLFDSDPAKIFDRWDEFKEWTGTQVADHGATDRAIGEPALLGAPVPTPRQVFAIGLNYRGHIEETGAPVPPEPAVFTKFPTSISGPFTEVALPGDTVDWEAELVVAIGVGGHHIAREAAWDHVAGLMVGQDLSERRLQMVATPPQFSLAKSYPGFSPIGPWLVTLDEVEDRDNLSIECRVNGEVVQHATTEELVFDVATLIEKLSAVCPLLPGDLIFTGTPHGVGAFRTPQWFLKAGDELTTTIDGLGSLRQQLV